MGWKSIVSSLHGSWTKTKRAKKSLLLHIRCCGYAAVFPQTLAKVVVFLASTVSLTAASDLADLRNRRVGTPCPPLHADRRHMAGTGCPPYVDGLLALMLSVQSRQRFFATTLATHFFCRQDKACRPAACLLPDRRVAGFQLALATCARRAMRLCFK